MNSLLEGLISPPSFLRWLDRVFKGQYLQSLSRNYVAINKDLENITTAAVLDKDKNLLLSEL